MKITFLGGVGEVTGSKSLIENEDTKVLIDCGLFQGAKELLKRNWDSFPIEPSSIDTIILTHAHIDHTGYIPVLIKNGFRGTIYCSQATYDLCTILLVDSANLQEEYARKKSKKPLYRITDAERSLKFFRVIDYDKVVRIGTAFTFTLIRSGHILGSAFVVVSDGKKTITFSGDLGRPDQLIMKSPPYLKRTDFLVMESTYGDRLHDHGDSMKEISELVNNTIKKGGVLIIPAFAVARTQTILYCLYQLKQKKIIPNLPVFLDSPMGISVTELLCKFNDEIILSPRVCKDIDETATYTRTARESKRIGKRKGPMIIIAGSGMASGGRSLDHFKNYISDAKNTIAFVGYQAKGTIGRSLVDGVKSIRLDGKAYRVRAEIAMIRVLSAHADYKEMLDWLGHFKPGPKEIFLNHGESKSALSLKKKIEKRFGWRVVVPKYLDSFDLD